MNRRILAAALIGTVAATLPAPLTAGAAAAPPGAGTPPVAARTAPPERAAEASLLRSGLGENAFREFLSARGRAARTAPATANATTTARPPEGSFVRDPADGSVYRVVGRSLLYVSSWAPFGGPQRVTTLTPAMWWMLLEHPADGTFVTSIQERRVYRFVGGAPIVVTTWAAFGGKPQKTITIDSNAITQADRCQWDEATYKYCFVARVPLDYVVRRNSRTQGLDFDFSARLFLRSGQDGRIFRVAGGAAIYVGSWTEFGGPQPYVTVDGVAIERAGQAGPFAFIRSRPVDNTTLVSHRYVFTIIGGAPVVVSHPAALTLRRPTWPRTIRFLAGEVDGEAMWQAGRPGPWQKGLDRYPADGVTLLALPDGNAYTVTGGAPSPTAGTAASIIEDWWSDDRPVGFVGQGTIDGAGTPDGPYSHLRAPLG